MREAGPHLHAKLHSRTAPGESWFIGGWHSSRVLGNQTTEHSTAAALTTPPATRDSVAATSTQGICASASMCHSNLKYVATIAMAVTPREAASAENW